MSKLLFHFHGLPLPINMNNLIAANRRNPRAGASMAIKLKKKLAGVMDTQIPKRNTHSGGYFIVLRHTLFSRREDADNRAAGKYHQDMLCETLDPRTKVRGKAAKKGPKQKPNRVPFCVKDSLRYCPQAPLHLSRVEKFSVEPLEWELDRKEKAAPKKEIKGYSDMWVFDLPLDLSEQDYLKWLGRLLSDFPPGVI